MEHQSQTRRLAAVMFADIEGYTALFQRDEPAAMKQVQDHRADLDQSTATYNGEIIQFYGDGSVTVYDSVIDAIRSAMTLQQLSAGHRIPVRIGIHMGDLVYKGADIFGDVVNVASRIQSSGIAGSILISQKVKDELKNHPEIHTVRLGIFTLKNVDEHIELYAITNDGLAVPSIKPPKQKKKSFRLGYILLGALLLILSGYLLLKGAKNSRNILGENERIFIPHFKDHTQSQEYGNISGLASSYIIKVLSETAEADVISYESGLKYFSTNLAAINENPGLARRAGAVYCLNGNYDLFGEKKDSLIFYASILDLRTHENYPVSIPDVYCSSSNHWDCIKQMTSNITGYWRSKEEHFLTPTNDKAYEAFQKAQKLWADPDTEDQAKEYLLQSIGYDSLFLDAYFLLLQGFNNADEYTSELDTIQLVKKRFPNLTARQEYYLQYFEEDIKGNNIEAYKYFLKEYEEDPKDLFNNTTCMVMALEYLNDPMATIRFHKEIEADSLDLNTCVYCRTRINMAMQAYADLNDKVNARKLADQLRPYAKRVGQITRLIGVYIGLNDTSTVNKMIWSMENDISRINFVMYYSLWAAQYAILSGNPGLRDFYLNQAIQYFDPTPYWIQARCYLLKGDLSRAEEILQLLLKDNPSDKFLNSNLGMVYAKQGEKGKANAVIELLEKIKPQYDFGETSYMQGRIKALMGETETALKLLSKALDEGVKFRVASTFQHDPDLIVLASNPAYLKLLARNRQNK